MNFDPLPDADNAAVGSHHRFDFFRRHHMRVSLFIYESPVRKPGIQHACMMDSRISHRPDHIAGSNAAFGWGHHFRTLYKINA